MSDLKNPFLNDKEKMEKEKSMQDDFNGMENQEENKLKERSVYPDSAIQKTEMRDENEGLEIKDEGKRLRNVIVIMLVLLVLALIGLFAYNSLTKQKDSVNMENLNKNINVEVTDFDMKSDTFSARSIIVE